MNLLWLLYKGNLIHANIYISHIDMYRHVLRKGCLYQITNFAVISNNAWYSPIMSDYKIFLGRFTYVMKIESDDTNVPIYDFQFVDIQTI